MAATRSAKDYLLQYFRCLEFLHPPTNLLNDDQHHNDDENECLTVSDVKPSHRSSGAISRESECHPRGSMDTRRVAAGSGGMKLGNSTSPSTSASSTVHIDLSKSQSSRQQPSSSDPFEQLGLSASPVGLTATSSKPMPSGSTHQMNSNSRYRSSNHHSDSITSSFRVQASHNHSNNHNPKLLEDLELDEDLTTTHGDTPWGADDDDLNGLDD